jgi:hypothetical protein
MLEWTTGKPTEQGYYWLRKYLFATSKANGFKPTSKPTIVNVYSSFGEPLSLIFCGNDSVSSPDDLVEGEWYGPLEAPD